jgi:hypothetical protein
LKLREPLIFSDGEYPAGAACEEPVAEEVVALLRHRSLITRIMVRDGLLRVVTIGGRLYIVARDAVDDEG